MKQKLIINDSELGRIDLLDDIEFEKRVKMAHPDFDFNDDSKIPPDVLEMLKKREEEDKNIKNKVKK